MTGNSTAQNSLDYRYLSRQSFSPNQAFSFSTQDKLCPSPSMKRSFESQKVLDRISTFCDSDNLMQRVAFLQQEFAVYGYPSIKVDSDPGIEETDSSEFVDLINLVNISYDLLRLWRQALEAHNNVCDLQRSADAEITRLRHVTSRMKEELAGKERELKSRDRLQHQLTRTVEDLKKKLKSEQEKSKRVTSEMSARDTQFKHEKKKKLQEIDKLQSRLHQLLQDKRQERMLGIEILNSLQRSDGRRGKWHNDQTKKNNEQDMYRLIINNYEDSHQRLIKENEGMRQYLKEMQDELISALNERNDHDQSGASPEKSVNDDDQPSSAQSSDTPSMESDISEEPMSDGMFEMPYDLVKEDIEKSIRAKWRALKREIRRSRRTKAVNSENFKPNGQDFESIVTQQQELINYLTSGKETNGERNVPEDSYFLEEKAELEKQQKQFVSQKQAFDKDRQLYAEAVRQLDHQRQAFEFEKCQWYRDSFFQLTPFRSDGRPSTSPHQKFRVRKSPQQDKRHRQKQYSRSPLSPDAPLKFRQASDLGKVQSPIDLTQSLNHFQSSNGLSAENSQRFDWQWSKTTPKEVNGDFPHKTKSTPTNSIIPPSTVELYKALGLVYHGSDKENEDSTSNVDESSLQVCPRSSGKTSHPMMSVSSFIEEHPQSHIRQRRKRQHSKYTMQPAKQTSKPVQYLNDTDLLSGQKMYLSSHPKQGNLPEVKNDDSKLSSHARNIKLAHLEKKWNSVSELNSELQFHLRPRPTGVEIVETRPRCYSTPSTGKHKNHDDSNDSSHEFVSAKTSVENLSQTVPHKTNPVGAKVDDNQQENLIGVLSASSSDENLELRQSQAKEKLFFSENISNSLLDSQESQKSGDKSGRKRHGIKNFMKSILSPKWRDTTQPALTTYYSAISDSPQPSGFPSMNFIESLDDDRGNYRSFNAERWNFGRDYDFHRSVVYDDMGCHEESDVEIKFQSPISKSSTVLDQLLSGNTRNLNLSNSMPTLMLKDFQQQKNSQNDRKKFRGKARSFSFEGTTEHTSADRHKMALLSFSAKLKPAVGGFILRNGSLDVSSGEEDKLIQPDDYSALPNNVGNVIVNFAESQFASGLYDKWTNTNQPNPV